MKRENIHDLFSQAADRFSANVAIDCVDKCLTYSELENRSNNLANFLVASGASKGSIVAILADDSIEVIAAVIGILKAGCVFVPLDPSTPTRRLEAMVSEVSPEWFVVEPRFFFILRDITANRNSKANVICVKPGNGPDDCRGNWIHLEDYASYVNTEKPIVPSEPDDMCYIYFTSGSTGRPKGIAGRLKAIDHFIQWEIRTFGIGEGTRVSQLTTPSFDAFLRDVFVPLCAGGTVCVPDGKDIILDVRKLIDWIDEQQINLVHCVPSLFRSIVNEDLHPQYFSALKYILLAGERLLPSDVKRWMDVYGERVQLVNLYGPSETTMTKFFYFVKPSDANGRFIKIGKPMEGARALVVDDQGNPCPPGVVGEIYIRTPFCALGYYNQPGLTREVFIQNPFKNDPNDIVYKPGDLGRILADGNFEFLGRRDQQVKIRGIRIELGEIENLLRNHESVKDVVVVDREDLSGNKYLCGYVVLSQEVKSRELRDFLLKHLPDNMVPSAFVAMDAFPRTLSGKVDRRALPALEKAQPELADAFVAPRTPVEKRFAEIWEKVLGVEQVGIHDNFFELGGHSLLATQVISRLREAFQVELPLRHLFEAPTVAGLVESLQTVRWAAENLQAPPGAPVGDREEGKL